MPLTFIDIERQKNWRISLFFFVLLLFYLAVLAGFGAVFLGVPAGASSRFWVFIGITALLAAAMHFWFAAYDTVNIILRRLDARPPDPEDEIHRMFSNIVQEVHVVTGSKRTIQCAIIPSLSLNALAAEDLKGNALIAITEGLLSRLTRPQIEAVVCHEVHHILSGDCLETTVAASLFGTLSSAVEKFRYSSDNRGTLVPSYILAGILLQLGNLLNMFISREREYRADAASVRMSRNPLALAEALYRLSRSWRGSGFIGSGFEMLCIVNPQATALDEEEGFWADLLSTHPPLRKRMDILLGMARVSIDELDRKGVKRSAIEPVAGQSYFVISPKQEWLGPFTFRELAALPWFSPLSWIVQGAGQNPDRAWKDPIVNTIFLQRLNGTEPAPNGFTCPACNQSLVTATYEGTSIYPCNFCEGTLVETTRIPRIIARTSRDRPCTERINALARAVLTENQFRTSYQKINNSSAGTLPHLPCPKCKNPMSRGFYSQAHLIEVDRCSYCGLTWFEKDELEMLQCMIENRLVPDIADAAMSGARTEMNA